MSEMESPVLTSLANMKAHDVLVLDVRGKASFTDRIVIAGATSDRHARAIADKLVQDMRDQGIRPLGVEGMETPGWILVDLCDVVVHIMQEEERRFYALEQLWGTE